MTEHRKWIESNELVTSLDSLFAEACKPSAECRYVWRGWHRAEHPRVTCSAQLAGLGRLIADKRLFWAKLNPAWTPRERSAYAARIFGDDKREEDIFG